MRAFLSILAIAFLTIVPLELRADEAVLYMQDGIYRGKVIDDVPHGSGEYYSKSDGSTFEGSWVRGLKEGRGVYTSKSGHRTNLFYQLGELAIDYEALPDNYISLVCEFASELYTVSIGEYAHLENQLTVDGRVHTVKVIYKDQQKGGSIDGVSICKYVETETHPKFEMSEIHIQNIKKIGAKAKEFSAHLEITLFMPLLPE